MIYLPFALTADCKDFQFKDNKAFCLRGCVDQRGEESLCLPLQMIFICMWNSKQMED